MLCSCLEINRMTSSDGALVNILKDLAKNPEDITNTSQDLQYVK
jgi:hypothetical protein